MCSGVNATKEFQLKEAEKRLQETSAAAQNVAGTLGQAKEKFDKLSNMKNDIAEDPRIKAIERKKVCPGAQIRGSVISPLEHERT